MDWMLIVGGVAFLALFIGVAGYTTMTNKIITEQDKELARLKAENRRLEAALAGAKAVKALKKHPLYRDNPKVEIEVINNTADPFKPW